MQREFGDIKATSSHRAGAWFGILFGNIMFGVVGLAGLGTVKSGLTQLSSGERHWAGALGIVLLGLIFCAIGFGFFYFYYVKRRQWAAQRKALEARYPGQPWMLRKDWSARKVTSSAAGATGFMWFWVVGWWSAILLIGSVNRDKIIAAAAESWWQAAGLMIFPLGGLMGLMLAVQMTRSWLRYGRSSLWIDTLPGRLGKTFRGRLTANFRQRPAAGLEVEVVCERVTWRTRRRDGKRTQERIVTTLWTATHAVPASNVIMSARTGKGTLDIDVPLPPDLPPSGLAEDGDGIQWELLVREIAREDVPPGTPLFAANFEIPVYGSGKGTDTGAEHVPA